MCQLIDQITQKCVDSTQLHAIIASDIGDIPRMNGETQDLAVYVLARTDLPSMNAGKAISQGSF